MRKWEKKCKIPVWQHKTKIWIKFDYNLIVLQADKRMSFVNIPVKIESQKKEEISQERLFIAFDWHCSNFVRIAH